MKLPVKKVSTIAVGRTLRGIFNYFVDYVVYPFVLLKFGFLKGLIIMVLITSVENLATLILYFRMKIDWLGYEYVNHLKQWADTKTGIKKIIGSALRKSDLVVFFLLSTLRDSFETTAYFQHKDNTDKIRTGFIFTTSLIVGNLYWSLGVELFINSWLRQLLK